MIFDYICLLAVLVLGFSLIGITRGVLPRPGLTALRTTLAFGALVVGLAGSDSESLLGASLVVIGSAVPWGAERAARDWRPARALGWIAAGACLVLGFLVFVGFLNAPAPPGGPLYNETLEQVHAGMSREQVEAVVGPPRDAWRGHRAVLSAFTYQQRGYELWIGRDSGLLVLFDGDGCAVDVTCVPAFCVSPPSWAERVARGLSRRGRRSRTGRCTAVNCVLR